MHGHSSTSILEELLGARVICVEHVPPASLPPRLLLSYKILDFEPFGDGYSAAPR